MNKYQMGMVMSKQGADGSFKPIFVKEMQDPINPLKKVYLQTIICNINILISEL